MIIPITWEEILPIWQYQLWPYRSEPIDPTSAMCFLGGSNIDHFQTTATFFGYVVNESIVGVNSGHSTQHNYRSRGLWVNPDYRGRGIGQQLLQATIEQGRKEGYFQIWSYPRLTSWPSYQSVGFNLDSAWKSSDTSEANAYCSLTLAEGNGIEPLIAESKSAVIPFN